MVDRDGTFSYSGIVKVDFSKALTVSLLPNPAKDYVLIQSDKQPTRIELTDMSGKLLKRFVPAANSRYNLAGISKGLYLVRIVSEGQSETVRLLIE